MSLSEKLGESRPRGVRAPAGLGGCCSCWCRASMRCFFSLVNELRSCASQVSYSARGRICKLRECRPGTRTEAEQTVVPIGLLAWHVYSPRSSLNSCGMVSSEMPDCGSYSVMILQPRFRE